jgi:hypothetical protein
MARRATPSMFSKYKLSLLLHKTFIEEIPKYLNFDKINTRRYNYFYTRRANNLIVGLNIPNM